MQPGGAGGLAGGVVGAASDSGRDRLIALAAHPPDWVLGFQDEVWWSRIRQPSLRAWMDKAEGLRLVEQTPAADDHAVGAKRHPDPKTWAGYGLLLSCPAAPDTLPAPVCSQREPSFVEQRPVSPLTMRSLAWCCEKLAALGKKALLLIWDNASWPLSKAVRNWIRTHNRQVKQQGQAVRIVACFLPSKSPWLHRIEPHWMHAQRTIVDPARRRTAHEVADRVCAHFGCDHEPHLAITENVA